jgi:hypothetical protein
VEGEGRRVGGTAGIKIENRKGAATLIIVILNDLSMQSESVMMLVLS